MKDIISNLKKFDTWKNQLAIEINFISGKCTSNEHLMYLKDGNMKIMISDNADKFIEKHFQSSLSIYQICLDNNER